MRKRHTRTAAVVLAVAAGGLAAFALRPPAGTSTATVAARNPAVEVRTQVIRRTIHVIRHEPGAALRGSGGSSSIVLAGGHAPGHGHARTGASGAQHGRAGAAASAGVGAVATRSSGRRSGSISPSSGSLAPISTHASGSHSSPAPASSSRPVSTHASGSHGSSSGAASSRPVTRSSGGGHQGGGDGGDGHGGGDD